MEIQVGEFIRTKDGIKKIVKINEGKLSTYYGKYIVFPEYKNSKSINGKNILKHDFDIAKLIEEGDYVNGNKVLDNVSNAFLEVSSSSLGNNRIFAYMIKSVLTKEQFKAMEYEVKWNEKQNEKNKI